MRALKRNRTQFYYAPFVEKRPVMREDEWGNILETGEIEAVYGAPIPLKGNISAAKGEAQERQFGLELNYDKVIVLGDPDVAIDEYSISWIDILPVLDEDGETETPHDYIVKRIARSINSTAIAVSKVSVSI